MKNIFNKIINYFKLMFFIPNNLNKCHEYLDIFITKDILEEIKSDKIQPVDLHFTLGQWIRNSWGLWKGEGKLYKYLSSINLVHPDDMSGLIIESYFAKVKNIPFNIKDYIEECNTFYLNQKCQE